jgi:hypothetical protein
MGQFAAVGVAYAAEAENKRKLHRKITYAEFNFACKVLSNSSSTTISMGGFILLEFMRLGFIDAGQINAIRDKFLEFDKAGKSELSLEDLHRIGAIVIDKHSMRSGVTTLDMVINNEMDTSKNAEKLSTNFQQKNNLSTETSGGIGDNLNLVNISKGEEEVCGDHHTYLFEIDVEEA